MSLKPSCLIWAECLLIAQRESAHVGSRALDALMAPTEAPGEIVGKGEPTPIR